MLDKFLDLLFKCKPLFRAFVHIDYFIRYGRTFKYLQLCEDRFHIIRINKWNDKSKVAFYKKSYLNYEILKTF